MCVDIDILYTLMVTCNLNLHILHYSVVACQLLFFCTLWLISLLVDFMFSEESFTEPTQDSMKRIWIHSCQECFSLIYSTKVQWSECGIMREEEKKWTVALFSKKTWLTFITELKRINPSPHPFLFSIGLVCLRNSNKCQVGECFVWICMSVFPCSLQLWKAHNSWGAPELEFPNLFCTVLFFACFVRTAWNKSTWKKKK